MAETPTADLTAPDLDRARPPATCPRAALVARATAASAVLLGLAVLLGWALDVGVLKAALPGLVEMKANTAAAFVLSGAGLWAASRRDRPGPSPFAAACAALVLAAGLATAFQHAAGIDLGIDELLFRDRLSGPQWGLPPGRMALATAAAFVMTGASLLLLPGRWTVLAQLLACATALTALFSLAGYLFGEEVITAASPDTSLGLHATAGFAALAVGLLAAAPPRGPVAVLHSATRAGAFARLLVPAALGVTLGLGGLGLAGARAGWYGPAHGMALFALTTAAVLAGVVWSVAWLALRSEQVERDAEERFRLLVDGVKDYAIFMLDPEGRVASWNAGAQRLKGYAAGEVIGRHFSLFYPPEDVASGKPGRGLAQAQAEGRAEDEGWRVRKDGSRFWADEVVTPLRGPAGRLLGFAKVTRDITERRKAGEALRERQERYDAAVRATGQVLYDWDPSTNRLWWGGSCLETLGYRPEDLPDRLEGFAGLIHPEDRGAFEREIERVLATAEPFRLEYRVRRSDGAHVTVGDHGHFLRDPAAGRAARMVGFLADVSERKLLEEQYRQAQKMEAVGQLAGGVAHDFNNLLTVINGYSEMLLGSLPAGDPGLGPVGEIYKAGERAAMLTRRLLMFSRKEVADPKVLDLNAVAEDACKMLRRLIGEDVRLLAALQPSLDRVRADPGQLEQVIMNLAVNARDAMPQGGTLTVETANVELDETYARSHAGAAPGRYVMLAVSDTGCGMPPEVKARVFEPFFTTKPPGKGTGLGLATVFGIVKQSGGHVWVYSEAGRGTTFKVYLPSAGRAAADVPAEGPREVPRGSGTVLLVEDDDEVRAVTRAALEVLGYAALEARDGAEALRVCEAHAGPIDLLLTDVVMPGLSGRQVAEAVAQLRPEVKVLYVSGYTDDAVVRHGVLRAGAAFLQKPFTAPALARKVRGVLGG